MLKKKLSSQKILIGTQSSSEELLTTVIGQNEQEETVSDDVEERIQKYEKKLGQKLPLHNKQILRGLIIEEDQHWERWDARIDNNKYHDDY